MNEIPSAASGQLATVVESNKLIRNTYTLLSVTLLFSAIMATVSTLLHMPPITYIICIGAAFVIMWFVLPKQANSAAGLGLVFLVTGLMGFGLGPILSNYLALPNGSQIIVTAFGGTAAIFLTLSGYAFVTRRNFNFLVGFLMVGMIVALLAAIANIFMNIPALSLALSAAIILIMSGFILYDTSRIVRGEETNYIMATIGLYISIFNIFINLLYILGIFSDD